MMIDRHLDGIVHTLNTEFSFNPPLKMTTALLRQITTCIDITNIADYVQSLESKTYDVEKDFPNMLTPWDILWMEYSSHQITVVGQKKIGALVWAKKHEDITKQLMICFVESYKDLVLFGSELVCFNENNVVDLTDSGRYYSKWMPKKDEEDVDSVLDDMLIKFATAICFCHCRNIKIIKTNNFKNANSKRIKKNKQPFFRFNTVQISPIKKILQRDGKISEVGLKKALHICRGHFATYTQEAPLFGRVTGTFWKPMHVRGNKKEGVVIKDYEINPPPGLT